MQIFCTLLKRLYFSVLLPHFQIVLDLHQGYVKMMELQVRLTYNTFWFEKMKCLNIFKIWRYFTSSEAVDRRCFTEHLIGVYCFYIGKMFLREKKNSLTKITLFFPEKSFYPLFTKVYKIRRYLIIACFVSNQEQLQYSLPARVYSRSSHCQLCSY